MIFSSLIFTARNYSEPTEAFQLLAPEQLLAKRSIEHFRYKQLTLRMKLIPLQTLNARRVLLNIYLWCEYYCENVNFFFFCSLTFVLTRVKGGTLEILLCRRTRWGNAASHVLCERRREAEAFSPFPEFRSRVSRAAGQTAAPKASLRNLRSSLSSVNLFCGETLTLESSKVGTKASFLCPL